jgi:ubiquitin-conjugating enzyme E2 S
MINPNPESALNEEAGRLLIENYEDYFKHAQLMTNVHNKKTKWEELVPAPAPAATETNVATAEVEEAEKPKENAIPKTASKPLLAKPAPAKVALKQKNSLKRL